MCNFVAQGYSLAILCDSRPLKIELVYLGKQQLSQVYLAY